MMERMKDVIEDVKDYVSDKVDTVRDFCEENKDEILNAVIFGAVYITGSVTSSLYMSKQHIDDTEKINNLNTKVDSIKRENQKLSKKLDEANMENKNLKEKMEENYKTFKVVVADGTRHGSSEAARQLAYLAHSDSYKEYD